jgi:cytochrome c-type biogenesis protein CcmE
VDGIPGERTLFKVVATMAIAIGAAALCYRAADGPPKYRMVDELTRADDGKELRVHGWVKPGTLVVRDRAYMFALQKAGREVVVIGNGVLPDTLKPQSEVIVRGTLHDGVVQADEVLAKCLQGYGTRRTSDLKFE